MVIFKICAPFTDSLNEINNSQVDNAKDTGIVMPMYNLIEYSDNYLKTSGSLWQYYRDEPSLNNNNKYWGGSLIIGFWRLRRVYLLKEIDLRLIRIFTPRNCFYFSLMMSIINFNSFYLLLFDTFFVN